MRRRVPGLPWSRRPGETPGGSEGHVETFRSDFRHVLDPAIWGTSYWWGGRTLPSNGERQFYADGATDLVRRHPEADPFRIEDGVLVISARPTPDPALSGGLPYVSGMIATKAPGLDGFALAEEGHVEIRARVPRGRGLWPAFWMLPADGGWPPEIDVFEVLGHDPATFHAGAHWTDAAGRHVHDTRAIGAGCDLSEGFHDYGAHWTHERLRIFLDGRERLSMPLRAAIGGPMYLLAALAVGGTWGGDPDATTRFPAEFRIAHVRASAPATRRSEKG